MIITNLLTRYVLASISQRILIFIIFYFIARGLHFMDFDFSSVECMMSNSFAKNTLTTASLAELKKNLAKKELVLKSLSKIIETDSFPLDRYSAQHAHVINERNQCVFEIETLERLIAEKEKKALSLVENVRVSAEKPSAKNVLHQPLNKFGTKILQESNLKKEMEAQPKTTVPNLTLNQALLKASETFDHKLVQERETLQSILTTGIKSLEDKLDSNIRFFKQDLECKFENKIEITNQEILLLKNQTKQLQDIVLNTNLDSAKHPFQIEIEENNCKVCARKFKAQELLINDLQSKNNMLSAQIARLDGDIREIRTALMTGKGFVEPAVQKQERFMETQISMQQTVIENVADVKTTLLPRSFSDIK